MVNSMKLTLLKLGSLLVLHFSTPGPGEWYLYSLDSTGRLATIEYCGRATQAQPVSWIVPSNETNRLFQAAFFQR